MLDDRIDQLESSISESRLIIINKDDHNDAK